MNQNFWKSKRVLVTGHTGFKGSWLSLWLSNLGAQVTGYSLPPPTRPSLFDLAHIRDLMNSIEGDVRDLPSLQKVVDDFKPEIVLHLAAQSLVRPSYKNPIETYSTNVMGTAHVLEACRSCDETRAVVIVTSDKCYENQETGIAYAEDEPMGGYDPYSSSKGCAELITSAYRRSFFSTASSAHIASARAGNVIGGGDWSLDRLIPDLLAAFSEGRPAAIRNPKSTRPWQHVLEPLSGYLLLAERLFESPANAQAWNFGPDPQDVKPVSWVADKLVSAWGDNAKWEYTGSDQPLHEAHLLCLDSSKAQRSLGWKPTLSLDQAVQWIVEWHQQYLAHKNMRQVTLNQLASFSDLLQRVPSIPLLDLGRKDDKVAGPVPN